MQQYLDLLRGVMLDGEDVTNRTGVATRRVWGQMFRHNLADGFPLLTTKRVHFKSVWIELLWLLSGSTNIRFMREHDVTIWNEWADEQGELGRVYGWQWRHWQTPEGEIDQIAQLLDNIRAVKQDPSHPAARRLLVSAWNVADIEHMRLPPCHYAMQFQVSGDKLNCMVHMRSADLFLGVPFNIASYATLTMMIAQVVGLKPGTLVSTLADAHIYHNHFDVVREQLLREPKPLPHLMLSSGVTDLFAFQPYDFSLEEYNPDGKLAAPVAV